MARAIAAAAQPAQAADDPPAWLLDDQVTSFRRVLAAVRTFGGALLADPAGTGKTYVGLAVATRWSSEPPTCLVPAALAGQWRETARRLSVEVRIVTHQAASRGRLPRPAGLVVIDESHHLRNAATRRYRHVARWLVGQAAILLSATPVVNRVDDLVRQLALVLRDDVLALHGIASLRDVGSASMAPPGLAGAVIAGGGGRGSLPARVERGVRYRLPAPLLTLLARIDRLTLSTAPPVATLVRGVLWRAAASSPAALAAALARYRALLLQARDARREGRALGREALRRWAGPAADQLVFWPLVADETDGDLDLADLEAIEELSDAARRLASRRRDDAKVACLRALLADGQRTIVFTSARETVADLRRRIAGAAWCTGSAAGIGRVAVPRALVLACFGPAADEGGGPRVLIATDVAAEGLDLHAASRVIHFDLPWTATRLEQRSGRAARRGTRHAAVEVVRLLPPGAVERRLGLARAIAVKAALPARIGLAPGDPLRDWRMLLEAGPAPAGDRAGVACMRRREGIPAGILAGVELRADLLGPCGRARWRAGSLCWVPDEGEACDDPAVVAAVLRAALAEEAGSVPSPSRVDAALGALDAPVRRLLRSAYGTRWSSATTTPSVRIAARRIAAVGRAAARLRDAAMLAAADRALAALGGGFTAGELLLLDEISELDGPPLLAALGALHARYAVQAIEPRLVGLVIVGR